MDLPAADIVIGKYKFIPQPFEFPTWVLESAVSYNILLVYSHDQSWKEV